MKQEMHNLFSPKELYLAEHDPNGHSRRIDSIPKYQRRKRIYNNMHLMEGMKFTDKNGFPQLAPYNGTTDFEAISYSDRKRYSGKNQAVHFFLDDYKFRDAVWNNLDYSTYALHKFDYYFTPDLSVWKDLPTDFYNKENLYRTRFVGAYWQLCGYNVIPTASWGNMDSFKYCFEGLPEYSVIAVSGMGHHDSKGDEILWHYALQELERQKHPVMIIVYGDEESIPNISTPIKFIPCFISKRFRK